MSLCAGLPLWCRGFRPGGQVQGGKALMVCFMLIVGEKTELPFWHVSSTVVVMLSADLAVNVANVVINF